MWNVHEPSHGTEGDMTFTSSLPCFPTSLWFDVVVYHILSGFSVFKPKFIQFLLLRSAFAVNDLAPWDFANIWFQHWFHGLTCGISEGYILRKTDDAALEFPIHHPGQILQASKYRCAGQARESITNLTYPSPQKRKHQNQNFL